MGCHGPEWGIRVQAGEKGITAWHTILEPEQSEEGIHVGRQTRIGTQIYKG